MLAGCSFQRASGKERCLLLLILFDLVDNILYCAILEEVK